MQVGQETGVKDTELTSLDLAPFALFADSHSLSTSPRSLGRQPQLGPGPAAPQPSPADPRTSHHRVNTLVFLPLLSLRSKITFT